MKARSTAETLRGLEKQHGQTLQSVWKPMALQSLLALIPAAASRQTSDCSSATLPKNGSSTSLLPGETAKWLLS